MNNNFSTKIYFGISVKENVFINDAIAIYQNKIYPVNRIERDSENQIKEFKIYDEQNEEHFFELNWIADHGICYISLDKNIWWEFKKNNRYVCVSNDDLAIDYTISGWCVYQEGALVASAIASLDEAVKYGNAFVQDERRSDIIDRLQQMLNIVRGNKFHKLKITSINHNFVERKTGGLLKEEIETLNNIWDQYK